MNRPVYAERMLIPTPTAATERPADAAEPEPGRLVRAWRFASVAWVAARIYAGYKSIQLWARIAGDKRKEERYRRQDARAARALYRSAVRMQGMLIKACQFIATRADVLPDAWVNTLSGLHDRVPPHPFATIRARIENELGRPLEAVFAEFDPAPLAAASLAQVHAARLHDGRRCAVKVQYPGIEGIVRADLRNLAVILRVLAWLERDFDFRVLSREAFKYIPMELDFEHEADNCETIARNLAARADVVVPRLYRELSTRRVLVMELVEGIKVTDVAALERAGIDKQAVAQKLMEVFCEQVLRDGFFHADPHPGNVMVQPGPRLVLLDFGLAKDFPPRFRDGIVRLTFSILTFDNAGIAAAFEQLGFRTRDGSPATLITLANLMLGNTIRRGRAYADRQLIEEFSAELPRALRVNPIVEVPADVLLVTRVMGLLSGLGKTLDSRVDLFATIMPYAHHLLAPAAAADLK
ncbi:MAG TPA: AarF/UbiB family protein [Candidatus Binataceae bacterium]|nr:AarF/UbiB family protein [Candidatus Binataceae bacterium]